MLAWQPQRTLTVVLVLVALAPWLVVVERVQTAKPVASSARPSAIVWSDRVFNSEHDLAVWLRSRGASYSDWAAQHPGLARILTHGGPFNPPKRTTHPTARRAPRAPAPTTVAQARTTAAPTTTARSPTALAPASRGDGFDAAAVARHVALFLAKALMLLLVLALLAFSLGPDRTIVRVRPGLAGTGGMVELRVAAFAAALSLGIGVLAAHLLG